MRFKTLYLFITLMFFTLTAHAISFGEVSVKSYLNQNLNAKIKISNAHDFPLEKIKVEHASYDDYRKYDLLQNNYLRDITISVAEGNDGEVYAFLLSRRIIREPLLSLILTLRWPEGNLSKEFNILISPATVVAAIKSKESIPKKTIPHNTTDKIIIKPFVTDTVKISKTTSETTTLDSNEVNANTNVSNAVENQTGVIGEQYRTDLNFDIDEFKVISEYGPIANGEVISMIAQKIRPDDSYSVQKISKLLFQLNKDAFIGGYINQLKAGSYIVVPDLRHTFLRKDKYQTLNIDDKVQHKQQSQQQTQELSHKLSTANPKLVLLPTDAEKNNNHSMLAQEQGASGALVNAENNSQKTPESQVKHGTNSVTEEKLALSLKKIDLLTQENELLKKQFDLIMKKVDNVVAENKLLEKELKQYKSGQIVALKDNIEKTKATTEVAEVNEYDEPVVTAQENKAKDIQDRVVTQEKDDQIEEYDEANNKNVKTALDKTTDVEATITPAPIEPEASPIATEEENEAVNKEQTINVNPASSEVTSDNRNNSLLTTIPSWMIMLLVFILLILLVVYLWLRTSFKQQVLEKFSQLKERYYTERYVHEEFSLDGILDDNKEETAVEKTSQQQNENEKHDSAPQEAFVQQLVEKADEGADFEFDLPDELEVPTKPNTYVSPVQSVGFENGPAENSVQGSSVQGGSAVQGGSVQGSSVQSPSAVQGNSVQANSVQGGSPHARSEQVVSSDQGATLEQQNSADSGLNLNEILGTNKPSIAKSSVDLISQASVYFAYGKFELAEQLIIEGIQTQPDNKGYHLKLLECYAKKEDEEKFLAYLDNVKSFFDSDEKFRNDIEKIYKTRWDKSLLDE